MRAVGTSGVDQGDAVPHLGVVGGNTGGAGGMTLGETAQEQATRVAAPWVARLARYGYASKGAVYMVVGWLSLQAALGTGGATTDSEGALRAVFRQPMGPFMLVLIGVGLFAYTTWRLCQSLLDVEKKGRDFHGLLKRTGYMVSGLAYGGLGVSALRQAIGLTQKEGRSQEDWTALVLAHPLGRILVIGAGAVLAGLALNAAIIAVRRLYRRKLEGHEIPEALHGWVHGLAIVGLLARGWVFGLLAIFFVQAGWESDPDEAGGLSDVLVAVAGSPQGPWLLGAMSVGLVAYGLFAEVQARFRRIRM